MTTTSLERRLGSWSSHWTAAERQALRDDVPRFGFKARIRDRYLFEIARECVTLSHSGLRRRGRIDHLGRDESRLPRAAGADPRIRAARPAEEMLEKFNGAWGGSVEPAYRGIRVSNSTGCLTFGPFIHRTG